MLHPDFDRTHEFARERYATLRRQAELERARRRSLSPRTVDTLLAALGKRLVAAGQALQRRALPEAQRMTQFSS